MTVRLKNLRLGTTTRIFGPFVGIFAAGALLRWLYPVNWRIVDFFHALADALMVAGLIGACLDLYSSKFLIEEVSGDLAGKLVGRGLPPELQSHIREITKTVFVRSNYVKEYRFLRVAEDKFQVEVTVTFEVRNYSDAPAEYSPSAQDEKFFDPKFLALEYGISGESQNSFQGVDLNQLLTSQSGTSVKGIEGPKKVRLFPIRENEKSVCRVFLKYALTMPDEYTEVTHFGGATLGVTLRVAEMPDGYEFFSAGAQHTPGSTSWYYSQPFVTGQHVNAWWFRKTEV